LASLAVNQLVDAVPVSGGGSGGSASVDINYGYKTVRWGGKTINSLRHPAALDYSKRPNAKEIMTEFPGLHVAYISKPNKATYDKATTAKPNAVDSKYSRLQNRLPYVATAKNFTSFRTKINGQRF